MRRLIALGIAIALVVVALVIRNGIDNASGGGGGSGKLRLVCAPELESVCNKLGSDVDVKLEDPGSTADRLEKADALSDADGWLTPGPWPQIVEAARAARSVPPLLKVGPPLARFRVGLAVWPDRLVVLNRTCPGLTWRCIGDVAAKGSWAAVAGDPRWGLIKLGLPDASQSATGLATLGAATNSFFGATPIDLQNDAFRAWLRALGTASNGITSALEPVLAAGPALADAVAVLDATATPALAGSARPDKPTLTYPAPVASADVVLGSADTARGLRLAGLVTPQALRAAGWGPAGGPSTLPAPDLLDALRTAWRETVP